MTLVPKFPDIKQNSGSFLESVLSKSNENNNQIFPKCNEILNKKISYSINDLSKKTQINLKNIEWLINLEKDNEDKEQFHEIFMQNYHKIFQENNETNESGKKKIVSLFPKDTKKKIKNTESTKLLAIKNGNDEEPKIEEDISKSHNIKQHLDKIHVINKRNEIEDPELQRLETFKRLRRLVKKFPFERNDNENREIFLILNTLDDFKELFPLKIRENEKLLEKLCGYASIETVQYKNIPVLGNFGFYIVLKGSVQPLSAPHLNKNNTKLRQCTPEPKEESILGIGSCFGTITELKGREMTTRMFRVLTLEDGCEFLKLSIESLAKITKKIEDEEKLEKLNAIKNCKSYSSWPKHTIEELMAIFEWRTFGSNTILTNEGYRSPFIGFITKGNCHVLRKVDVPFLNKKTGAKEKRMKQVVIGKLSENESFGEVSAAIKEQMHCTIVTETYCKIGIIPCDKINKLDNITLRLLLQTNNRTFADMTEEDLHKKFIEQEKNKEWKQFKNKVVNNVIQKYGISKKSLEN